jgi:hypothetical protein
MKNPPRFGCESYAFFLVLATRVRAWLRHCCSQSGLAVCGLLA